MTTARPADPWFRWTATLALHGLACADTPSHHDASTSSTSTGPQEEDDDDDDDSSGAGDSDSDSATGDASGSTTGDDPPTTCCGCLCVDPSWSCSDNVCVDAEGHAPEILPEAGFLELDAGTYEVDGVALTSARHRVWYAFQPADDRAEDRPVVLLFNGGPGNSTAGLFGLGTGAFTVLDDDGDPGPLRENPASWTAFANLLYVDAPAAGFSYALADDGPTPSLALDADRDAAAFVRVLLRFLERHPALHDNPVLIAGESYGGTRAALMAHQLLFPDTLTTGPYHDVELAAEIDGHLTAVRGAPGPFTPAEIAEQFVGLVLIQPLVAGQAQLDQQALDLADFPAVCRNAPDFYQCDEAPGWTNDRFEAAERGLLIVDELERALGVDPRGIAWLYADAHQGMVGHAVTYDEAELRAVFGDLPGVDGYYVPVNWDAKDVLPGARDFLSDHLGAAFLEDVAFMRTFVTDAGRDVAVWGPSIPASLRHFSELATGVLHDTDARPGVARPGWIDITYAAGAIDGVTATELRFPHYPEAGHAVMIRSAEALRTDVMDHFATVLE
ncbi:MAG: hypothetical protein JNK45_20320 [Myxococcales bacterium]|nr:hypothetical protein [Myxococcales bacterium]